MDLLAYKVPSSLLVCLLKLLRRMAITSLPLLCYEYGIRGTRHSLTELC